MTIFKSDKTGLYILLQIPKGCKKLKNNKNGKKWEYLERKEMVESDILQHKCCWRFQAIQVF